VPAAALIRPSINLFAETAVKAVFYFGERMNFSIFCEGFIGIMEILQK
jgi:hypothetical protein